MTALQKETMTAAMLAAVIGAVAIWNVLAATALLLAICGITMATMDYRRTTFGLVATGVALVTFNALRPSSSVTISDLFLILAVIVFLVGRLDAARPIVSMPPWLWVSAGLFALAAGLVVIFPSAPSEAALYFPGGIYSPFPTETSHTFSNFGALARLEFALILVPFLLTQVATSTQAIRTLAQVWLAGIVLGSLLGILAFLGIAHLPALVGGNPNVEVTRIRGLSTHPNVFGMTAAMVLPVALVLYGPSSGRSRYYYSSAIAILLLAVAVSGSRAAVIGVLTGVSVLALLHGGARKWVRRGAIALIGLVMVGGLTTFENLPGVARLSGTKEVSVSDHSRSQIYSKVWSEIEHRPIIGHGFQYLRGSHNIYMQSLHAGGAIGFCALLALVIGVIWCGLQAVRASPDRPLAAALLASSLVWLFAGGLFEPAIFDRYLYIPIGLVVAAWAVTLRERSSAQPDRRGTDASSPIPVTHEAAMLSGVTGIPAYRGSNR